MVTGLCPADALHEIPNSSKVSFAACLCGLPGRVELSKTRFYSTLSHSPLKCDLNFPGVLLCRYTDKVHAHQPSTLSASPLQPWFDIMLAPASAPPALPGSDAGSSSTSVPNPWRFGADNYPHTSRPAYYQTRSPNSGSVSLSSAGPKTTIRTVVVLPETSP